MRLFSLLLTGGILMSATVAHAAGTLTVYTYDSFTAEWGPGPQVEKAFEAECGCDVRFVALPVVSWGCRTILHKEDGKRCCRHLTESGERNVGSLAPAPARSTLSGSRSRVSLRRPPRGARAPISGSARDSLRMESSVVTGLCGSGG